MHPMEELKAYWLEEKDITSDLLVLQLIIIEKYLMIGKILCQFNDTVSFILYTFNLYLEFHSSVQVLSLTAAAVLFCYVFHYGHAETVVSLFPVP